MLMLEALLVHLPCNVLEAGSILRCARTVLKKDSLYNVVTLAGGTNLMRHAKKSTNRDFRMTFREVSEQPSEAVEQTS